MIKKLFVILTVLFSIQAFAQDDEALSHKKANYQINSDYKSGNFLIYNCEKSYYACVDEDSSNKCKEKRQEAIDKKMAFYPCASLNKFPTKTKCAQTNYEVVESLAKKRFCYPKN